MPKFILKLSQNIDKNDQCDLRNLAIHEFRLVSPIIGS